MKLFVLVSINRPLVAACDWALQRVEQRGVTVWRYHGCPALDLARNHLAFDALAQGYDELVWIDPDLEFHPEDIDRLREHRLPFVAGLYPREGRRGLACTFPPGLSSVTFGRDGGLVPLQACGFGFVYTHRSVYTAIQKHQQLPTLQDTQGKAFTPYFSPFWTGCGRTQQYWEEAGAFCERARQAGVNLVADTRLRLWHVHPARHSWEDVGAAKERYDTYTVHFPPQPNTPAPEPILAPLDHGPFQEPARPLPSSFPKLKMFVMTYSANADSLSPTLASIHASDWGEEPTVVTQPSAWPHNRESAAQNYRRILEQAVQSGCDFAVILEDDVRVCRWLRHNLTNHPLVKRDVCDYLSLFMPDLIASPWERSEPHLGYSLARPLYSGPNELWEKHRIWGSQGYVLSRRFMVAALERWNDLQDVQDTRVLSVCSELKLPLWCTAPCYVEHEPLRTAFGTPTVRAVDFAPEHRLELGAGFQPPEGIPGRLTNNEGRLLFEWAKNRSVLELNTGSGRATVCLAQTARQVISVSAQEQATAQEWVRRYGVQERVNFAEQKVSLQDIERFELAFLNTAHDAATIQRDLDMARRVLVLQGLIACHDYPDPDWPEVRRVVDEYVVKYGWRRVAQDDYVAVFQT